MSVEEVQSNLADAYALLSATDRVLFNIDSVSLRRLEEALTFVRRNIEDAMSLINDAEAELDEMRRKSDEEGQS